MRRKLLGYGGLCVSGAWALLTGLNAWRQWLPQTGGLTVGMALLNGLALVGGGTFLVKKKFLPRPGASTETKAIKKTLHHARKLVHRYLHQRQWRWRFWPGRASAVTVAWIYVLGDNRADEKAFFHALSAIDLNDTLQLDPTVAEYGCRWYLTPTALYISLTEAALLSSRSASDAPPTPWLPGVLFSPKRSRQRKNRVNSLTLLLNASDFLQSTEQSLTERGLAWYHLIHPFSSAFKTPLRLQLLFTECGALRGYDEFYSHLSSQALPQTLAFIRPVAGAASSTDEFFHYYDKFVQTIFQMSDSGLYKSATVEEAYSLFYYPYQLLQLKAKLSLLLPLLLRASPNKPPLWVQSCHFTSTRLAPTRLDPLNQAVYKKFGFSPCPPYRGPQKRAATGQALALIRARIIEAAQRLPTGRPALYWCYPTFLAGFFGLLSLSFFAIGHSLYQHYNYNKGQLRHFSVVKNEAETHLFYWMKQPASLTTLLHQAELLESLSQVYQTPAATPLFPVPWGFSAGNRINRVARKKYHQFLKRKFRPFLLAQVQTQLQRQLTAAHTGLDTLHLFFLYLMLARPNAIHPPLIKEIFAIYCKKNGSTALIQGRLQRQFAHLLAQPLPTLRLDAPLVKRARHQLRPLYTFDSLYHAIENQVKKTSLKPVFFSTRSNINFRNVFGKIAYDSRIPAFYTPSGYRAFQTQLQELTPYVNFANQALNGQVENRFSSAEFKRQMNKIYFYHATRRWLQTIQAFHIAPFHTLTAAETKLAILSDPTDSPLLTVFKALTQQATEEATASSPVRTPVGELATLTHTIHNPAFIKTLLRQLHALGEGVSGLNHAANPSKAAFKLASAFFKQGPNKTFAQVYQLAQQAPVPLKNWLTETITYTWQSILSAALRYINTQWQQQIWPVYKAHIAPYYPFQPGQADLTLSAFSDFFCQKGLFMQFWATYLSPFLTRRPESFRLKKLFHRALPLSENGLEQLRYGWQIQHGFCANHRLASLHFTLSALRLSDNSAKAEIHLGQARLIYRHGPRPHVTFTWPDPSAFPQTSLQLVTLKGKTYTLSKTGVWSDFKVFQQGTGYASEEQGAGEIKFHAQGQTVVYGLLSHSGFNPFVPHFFTRFQLPSTLGNFSQQKGATHVD